MESMVKKLKQKRRSGSSKKTDEEEWFSEKGSIFLEKLIPDCNGKSIPIRSFSSSQIRKATNNFSSSFLVNWSWDLEWHIGDIENKSYLIKRFLKDIDGDSFNDIVLSARMSNHNNFLKLIGCCFELSSSVVVFEYADHRYLSEEGRLVVNGEESILPWNVRLKIAKEVAIAVSYLHMAFPRIIIHKNINPTNIFLDNNWKAKLTDFTISVSLPPGKSRIQDERISGTYGYFDPLYVHTRFLSEYTDVYSFGVCLLVFLTGRSPYSFRKESVPQSIVSIVKGLYENGKLDEVIDPMIAKDITGSQRLQVEAYVVLALRCCKGREEERPKMIQVAKELKRIERIEQSLDASKA